MGDAPGENTQALQALHLLHVLLELAAVALGLFELRDVSGSAHYQHVAIGLTPASTQHREKPPRLAGLGQDAELE